GIAADRDDWHVARGIVPTQRARELEAVHAWHCDVGHDHIRPSLTRLLEGAISGWRLGDVEAGVAEEFGVHLTGVAVVLHEQHVGWSLHKDGKSKMVSVYLYTALKESFVPLLERKRSRRAARQKRGAPVEAPLDLAAA